jgi:uncharacterized membrane protein YsdA (DUF1294 family)
LPKVVGTIGAAARRCKRKLSPSRHQGIGREPGWGVAFEIELTREGENRARKVNAPMPSRASKQKRNSSPARRGVTSLLAVAAFVLFYLVIALAWHVPNGFAALYVVASVACFGAYAADKSAAVAGRWRVAESTLLLLGLVGGWPGAVLAQQVLRHKARKASFQWAFWGTVALNVVAFVAASSPLASALLRGV